MSGRERTGGGIFMKGERNFLKRKGNFLTSFTNWHHNLRSQLHIDIVDFPLIFLGEFTEINNETNDVSL